jgi:thioredoxin-related protein
MQKIILLILPITFLFLSNSAPEPADKIEWLTIDQALEKNLDNPKSIFVDVYTDWCGWCKKMDATTFVNPKITELMNEHFHAVKFDAEQKASVNFNGDTYKFVANGRRGYNEFAATILQGKMSYPSYAILDENLKLVTVIPGYREVKEFEPMLIYLGEKKYTSQTYPEFLNEYNAGK